MPNYCENQLVVTPNNKENLDNFIKAITTEVKRENQLFNHFLPTPKELLDNSGWYEWRINNWGTKWNPISVEVQSRNKSDDPIEPTEQIDLTFDTAYSPPIQFYQHLESLGFTVFAMYYEPGCAFVGKYFNGKDTCYDLSPESIKIQSVKDLLDEFGRLEDYQEQYAEDEENA